MKTLPLYVHVQVSCLTRGILLCLRHHLQSVYPNICLLMRTVKALARFRGCAVSFETLVLAYTCSGDKHLYRLTLILTELLHVDLKNDADLTAGVFTNISGHDDVAMKLNRPINDKHLTFAIATCRQLNIILGSRLLISSCPGSASRNYVASFGMPRARSLA